MSRHRMRVLIPCAALGGLALSGCDLPPTDTGDSGTDGGTMDAGTGTTDPGTTDPGTDTFSATDQDGDGVDSVASGGTDCDDTVAEVHPGAQERCDNTDWDCDGVANPPGLVSFTSAAGTVTDLSSAFAAGTATQPFLHTVDESGVLGICSGTYSGEIYVASGRVHILGSNGPILRAEGKEAALFLASPEPVDVAMVRLEDGAGADSGQSRLGGLVYIGPNSGAVSFRNITLTTGTADYGGLLYLDDQSSLSCQSCSFEGGSATVSGGAIYASTGSTIALEGTQVMLSDAVWGGGVYLAPGAVLTGDASNSSIKTNHAELGGGVLMSDGSTLTGTRVISNTADNAAGVAVYGAVSLGSDVGWNTTPGWVGGVYITAGSSATITGGLISNNSASVAGGVYVEDGGSLSGVPLIEDNYGETYAGGVYAAAGARVELGGGRVHHNSGWQVAGVYLSEGATLLGPGEVSHNDSWAYVGGIYADGSATVTDVAVHHNNGELAGGVGAWGATLLQLNQVAITDNSAVQDAGLSVIDSSVVMSGGSLLRNAATLQGGGAGVSGGQLRFENTDLGAAPDDNSPQDVITWDSGAGFSWTGGQTLTCTGVGC